MTRTRAAALPAATVLALLGCLAAGPAVAQLTDADAAAAERDIKEWLDRQVLASMPGAVLDIAPGVTVETDGERLIGSIPDGRILIPIGPDRMAVVDMTAGGFTATQLDNGWYDIAITLPDRWLVSEYRTGDVGAIDALTPAQPPVEIAIGGQDIAMVFAPAYQAGMAQDMTLRDITVTSDDLSFLASIDLVRIGASTSEAGTGPDRYDGDGFMTVEGMRFDDGGSLIDIAGSEVTYTFADADYAALRDLNQRMLDAQADFAANPNDPDAALAMFEVLAEMPALADSMSFVQQMTDMSVNAQGMAITLAELSWGMALSGMRQETSSLDLDFAMGDLRIDPMLPIDGLLPTQLVFESTLSGIPNAAVGESMAQFASDLENVGPEIAGPAFLFGIYRAAVDAEAMLDLSRVLYRSDVAEVRMESIVHPDTAAMFGVTVDAEVEVENTDGLQQQLMVIPFLGSALSEMIETVQGVAEITDQGDERYRLRITRDGMVLLNDRDLEDLLDDL